MKCIKPHEAFRWGNYGDYIKTVKKLCQVKCQTEKRSHLCVKPKNEQTTKQANKIPKFTDTENRFVAVRGGHGIWVKLVSVEKDYKFPVIE